MAAHEMTGSFQPDVLLFYYVHMLPVLLGLDVVPHGIQVCLFDHSCWLRFYLEWIESIVYECTECASRCLFT